MIVIFKGDLIVEASVDWSREELWIQRDEHVGE